MTAKEQVDVAERAVLLADVSGSSELYDKVGDEEAVRLVGSCIDTMIEIAQEHDGDFVHSRGDDVLCVFSNASAAMRAAGQMLGAGPTEDVAVHAGLHWGPVILARDEVFGDAVNLCARLSSLSNAGEVLISGAFVEELPRPEKALLRGMGNMMLKGQSEPVEVHALLMPTLNTSDQVTYTGQSRDTDALGSRSRTSITLSLNEEERALAEGAQCLIGRAEDCDLVVQDQWVSRKHAAIVIRRGLVEYSDRSSTGSYIRLGEDDEYFVHRQTVLLSGTGVISPGLPVADPNARLLRFAVTSEAGE